MSNLEVKAGVREISWFVERHARVRVRRSAVELLTDPLTKRSVGIAHVELGSVDEAKDAVEALNNLAFLYPKGNCAGSVRVELFLGPTEEVPLRVTGLWKDITKREIRSLFEPFGYLDSVRVSTDEHCDDVKKNLYSKTAHILFHKRADASLAVSMMNGLSVAENCISVSLEVKGGKTREDERGTACRECTSEEDPRIKTMKEELLRKRELKMKERLIQKRRGLADRGGKK